MNNPLIHLNFDQYSRQKIVYDTANTLRPDRPIKIIDLGGYKGVTSRFFTHDEVTILDVFSVSDANYIQGDATNTGFKDGSYSIATSFDVYEHIPSDRRRKFIKEAVRISEYGFFLAAPFNNGGERQTLETEISVNEFYKQLHHKKPHKWLQEHIDYGTPLRSDFEKILNDEGLYFTSVGSNDLALWQRIQELLSLIDIYPQFKQSIEQLNVFFNDNVYSFEPVADEKAYRRIYFISKNKTLVDKAEQHFHSRRHTQDTVKIIEINRQADLLWAKILQYHLRDKRQLQSDIRNLLSHVKGLDSQILSLQDQLTVSKQSLLRRKSPQWLRRVARNMMKRE